jgi:hypothetical protein
MMVTGMTDILDAVHHLWLKIHILSAGSVSVFRWQQKRGNQPLWISVQ